MASFLPLPPGFLLDLAPLELPNHRPTRYVGDDLCIFLNRLVPRDQQTLRDFYRVLTQLLFIMTDTASDDAAKWQEVRRWVQQHPVNGLVDDMHELGAASLQQDPAEALSKALHDLRGGPLSALLGRLHLLDRLPQTTGELNQIFVLTRDHLKIMRNAVVGLDNPRRDADRTPKAHAMRLMVDKWQDAVVGPKHETRSVRMHVDCRFDGALTECCLESAAIDRIFYNLANNACRHAATDRLDMVVFPVPDAAGACLRFVLSNEVNAEDAAYLRSILHAKVAGSASDRKREPSLVPLFTPRVSTTGSGYGLTVVADFVAGAFGLKDRESALRERYVGATLDGNTFRIWFHWPVANPALPPKLDDYHRPEQSLSEPK